MLLTCCTDLVPGNPHLCQMDCHSGSCPPCPQTTMVKCRCGNMDREIACQDLTTRADDARCEKKCTKVWIYYKLQVLSACDSVFSSLVSTLNALYSFTSFLSSNDYDNAVTTMCILPKKSHVFNFLWQMFNPLAWRGRNAIAYNVFTKFWKW